MADKKEYVTPEFVQGIIDEPGMMGPAIVELAQKYLALLHRNTSIQQAFETWQEKTEWVQENSNFPFPHWGMHRADVMTRHIHQLESEVKELQTKLFRPVVLNRSAVMSSTYVISQIRAAGFSVAPHKDTLSAGEIVTGELVDEVIVLRAQLDDIRKILETKP